MPNLWEHNHPVINISHREKASTDFIENFKTIYHWAAVEMTEFFKRVIKK